MIKNVFLALMFLVVYSSVNAVNCPDPQKTSLQWGIPPAPWVVNPYSPNEPQGDENTRFIRANILVLFGIGRGVVCTYRNTVGDFSIWWEVLTKVPSFLDYFWIRINGGFVCSESLEACNFYVSEASSPI